MDTSEKISIQREFLKAHLWGEWKNNGLLTDQRKGLPQPALVKPYPPDSEKISLIPPTEFHIGNTPLIEAITKRRSHREFSERNLNLEELSFLLWATQGVHQFIRNGTATRRTVPSGGARHPFETYVFTQKVSGLKVGLYRYLPVEHQLLQFSCAPELSHQIQEACYQSFVGQSAVVFIWTAIPYRTEWRYSFLAHKVIAQEIGHVCQNLYLASESIDAGTCALGTYNQETIDKIIDVDGDNEFTIYIAAVGKAIK